MPSFGLIAEGVTDHVVIENILLGCFEEAEIEVNPLQPLLDATDRYRQESYGGWNMVFDYCRSHKPRQALQYNDYLVIQIDSDVSDQKGFDVPKYQKGEELDPPLLVAEIHARLKEVIAAFLPLDQYEGRIIIAVAVHSLECWLLPLHTDEKKRSSKTKGCAESLERILASKGESFRKTGRDYERLSKKFRNTKYLKKARKIQPSLDLFIGDLEKIQRSDMLDGSSSVA